MARGDPLWHAAADHVAGLALTPQSVLAPADFDMVLPGCQPFGSLTDITGCSAVVLHKGELGRVPADMLVAALGRMVVTFANEVFLVLTLGGDPVATDSPHLLSPEQLLVEALRSSQSMLAHPVQSSPSRVPATYLGHGKLLLQTAFGHLMLVDGADTSIVPHLIRDGWFDRHLTDLLVGLLEPGMTFIDVGANYGSYALIAADTVGEGGRVVAVEASPRISAMLLESLVMNGFGARCDVVRCAAGTSEGKVMLHQFATRHGGNTVLAQVADAARQAYGETVTAVEIECRPLDRIVDDLGLERVDLIKIDVEGAEHDVLRGAGSVLARYQPCVILEWHPIFFAGREEEAARLHGLLTRELGYCLRRLEPDGSTREIGFEELMAFDHSDVVAEPRV